MNSKTHIQGWTLSETLVMMVVAGIVFLAVMDGSMLFMRYSQSKTAQIADNSRFYEGYYRLEHITASADSVSADNGRIHIFRENTPFIELLETDSLLIAHMGSRTDTLMCGISALGLKEIPPEAAADSLLLTVTEPGRGRLRLSFPIKRLPDRRIRKTLLEQETKYAYE